jgi:hypothetical protein
VPGQDPARLHLYTIAGVTAGTAVCWCGEPAGHHVHTADTGICACGPCRAARQDTTKAGPSCPGTS